MRTRQLSLIPLAALACGLVAVALMGRYHERRSSSLLSHVASEIDRAGAGRSDGTYDYLDAQSGATSSRRRHARGVDPKRIDKGLDTLNSDTIWENGSPQNSGWSEGDFSVGTGIIKNQQYGWWQRHLLPAAQFEQTINALKKQNAGIKGEDDADDPGDDSNSGPASFRGPGFARLNP